MSLTLTHADLAWLLGNYEHAIQACNIVLAQSKHTNAVATRQHAFESKSIAMWLRGDVVGSSTCSQLALELDSSAPRSLLIAGLSQTVLRQNAPPSSYRLMTEALNSEEANTDPLILTVRGIMQTLQCSHDAAAALYDEALARAKGYPLAIAYRGLNALRGVLGGTARAELLAAVLESPYLHVHAIAFASLLFGSGDRACALQWAQRAVALEPHFAHAQFLLAVLTAQLGSEEAREESAEVLAGMDPSSPFTDLARATCALISHDLVAARRALDGAQAKKLASHFYLEEKVCLLWREGKTEDALLEVTAAVADGYISTNLLALQGLILSDLQRYDEAICVLTQAQARDDLRDDLRLALAAAQAAAAEGMRDFQQRENLFRRSLALMQRAFGGLPVTGAVRSQARLLVARSLNGLHLYDAALAAANEVQTLDGAALAAAIQMQQKDNAEKAG